MKLHHLLGALPLAIGASLADAGVIINSIHMTMVDSNFSARAGSPTMTGDVDADFAAALNAIDSGGRPCTQSLDALTDITANGACGLGREDNGALYEIKGSSTGNTVFQFGLDWGRGGFLAFESEDSADKTIFNFSDDIWWQRRWEDNDVINYLLPQTGAFTLTLLGFEGCCDGVNSARYSSVGNDSPMLGLDGPMQTRSVNQLMNLQNIAGGQDAGEWTPLAVNAVPLPGSLPLVALGGLLILRRRQKTQP